MCRRTLVTGLLLVCVVLTLGAPALAAPLMQARSVITYPASGMTVSGVVQVTGIATHPNLNFYQLRYAPGSEPRGDSAWVDFAVVQATPVENGVLASWDTTALPDGDYTLALAVWGQDDASSPYVSFVTNLKVNNAQPVPSPTPEVTETPAELPTSEPMPTVVIGATPTPITIEQPATPTPRATAVGEPGAVAPSEPESPEGGDDDDSILSAFNFDTGELREAFCAGGIFVALLLVLWGCYLMLKAVIRWYFRHQRRGPPTV